MVVRSRESETGNLNDTQLGKGERGIGVAWDGNYRFLPWREHILICSEIEREKRGPNWFGAVYLG